MSSELDFELSKHGPLVEEVRRRGFDRFLALAKHVSQLPYGRPSNCEDFLAILKERRGTCSFKHRLLAAVAHECGNSNVELVVGLYAMSEQNTPGVGVTLNRAGFDSIPEAHCYLRLAKQRYDFTGLSSGSTSPFSALLSEHVICPKRLTEKKKTLHHQAVASWAKQSGLSFDDAWALREACIQALASNNALKPTGTSAGASGPAA
ncbi:hypothetical protein [Halopseudomonas pelagia]|uniref:Uncharacterized protein n=1 Tax=Halopseudomonas pelagia TaxID=553151 RepID=A0AA91Z6E2_9GAMM|nr:hypothetical protein [Halopseudomonas pelagia]PCC99604.1 hypothetical protein CO192_09625 [Halopseudomonas pelagia]QFY57289.1 hypothetical protein EAO82_13490 [Halopseudomonas pelagia]